ncbi:c-type cytochrome [Martelella sp. HB161492]|uniref:c-type cytochrome n=1 Tax=Martelella sp. HB161492 TaxID=2720726 RepID=UPI00159110B9|nr:c-type cytochrome [Martelella sp. HB161492]
MHVVRHIIAAVTALLLAAAPALAAGDAAKGQALFNRYCKACHTVEGTQNRVGPYLAGVTGRPVATAENYHYTPAMRAFADTHPEWTPDLLAGYLANPRAQVPGTRMAYAGTRDQQAAADLAAYLKSLPAAQ